MKLFVFAVKDRATDAFFAPIFGVAPGQIVRDFTDQVNRAADDNQFYRHPDDFDLYELGVFETESGDFDCGAPQMRTRGKDVSLNFVEKN